MKLISLNIEGNKHLDRQVPFFKAENPDVLCLQEVFETDFEFFKKELGMEGAFVPMHRSRLFFEEGQPFVPLGLAILTKCRQKDVKVNYYWKTQDELTDFIFGEEGAFDRQHRFLLTVCIESASSKKFFIGSTHFTWSFGGNVSESQLRDMSSMMKELDRFEQIILCGDFNAPRGREIFGMLASKYIDAVPPEYITSLDNNLHKVKDIPSYMVDGLFHTRAYEVKGVRLKDGVSDHCAIVAEIN